MYKFIILIVIFIVINSCSHNSIEYWPNGNKKQEIQYKGKEIHGTFTLWRKSGKMEMQSHYENGKIIGKSTIWFYNGTKKSEENYCDGLRCGAFIYYKRNGNKLRVENYKNDTLHGVFTEWHNNSDKKMKEGNYNKGLFDGKWLFWNINGKIVGFGDFINGDGGIKEFDSEGKLLFHASYTDNNQDSIIYSFKQFGSTLRYE